MRKVLLFILVGVLIACPAYANQQIRQSTGVTVTVGPILDPDTKAPLTSVTLAGVDYIRIHKPNGGAVVDLSSRTWVHRGSGIYDLTLLSTDVDTIGLNQIILTDADTFWPERLYLDVVTANKWDSDHGVAYLSTNVVQVSGDSVAADNLESYCDGTTFIPVNLMRINSQQYVEGTYTPLAWLRLQGASLFGDIENSGSTYYFRNVADTANRITVDLTGPNRDVLNLNGD